MPPPMPGTGASRQVSYGAPAQMQVAYPAAYARPDKSVGVAYVLWFFFGVLGVHHFYLGKVGRGVWYVFTFAFLTVGLWVDLFTLPSQVRRINAERRAGLR